MNASQPPSQQQRSAYQTTPAVIPRTTNPQAGIANANALPADIQPQHASSLPSTRPVPPPGNVQPIKPYITSSSGPSHGALATTANSINKKQATQDAARPSSGQQENATGGPSNNKAQSKANSAKPYSKPLELRTDPRAVVSKLLFVHGDVETPASEAVDFVLDIAHDFMTQLMNPGPAPRPNPPDYNSTSQSQTITTSTLKHRLRGPHNRKKLAVLQEAIIKQKLAADKAKKAIVVNKGTKKKTGDAGEDSMDVDDLAANLDMPGVPGFGGIF